MTTPSGPSGSAPRTPRTASASSSAARGSRATGRPGSTRPGVPLNGVGRFTFVVQAPPVAAERKIAETFAPVAETLFWMLDEPATIEIRRSVRASRPRWRSLRRPPSTTLGAPITVTATASDNVRVQRVDFSLCRPAGRGGDAAAPYEIQVPTAGLGRRAAHSHGDGLRRGRAGHGEDADRHARGRSATAPARAATRSWTAGFGRRLTARHTVGYGRADRVRGRLTTAAGAPIAAASLQIFTRVVLPRRTFRYLTFGEHRCGRQLHLRRATRTVAADPHRLHRVLGRCAPERARGSSA